MKFMEPINDESSSYLITMGTYLGCVAAEYKKTITIISDVECFDAEDNAIDAEFTRVSDTEPMCIGHDTDMDKAV